MVDKVVELNVFNEEDLAFAKKSFEIKKILLNSNIKIISINR